MIELHNVSKEYGRTKVLHDVSVSFDKGEFVSVVGHSGAGKSTIVKLLTCEEVPTRGRIIVAGRDITQLKPKELPYYRRKIGVIFQDFKLLPQKTVYENVAYALEVCDYPNADIKKRVSKVVELVGLSHRVHNYPNELSGGERQRVAIARALIHSPKILIADEPSGNLDPVNTWEIMELLYRINRSGALVILTTHNKTVVDRLKKRVVLMKGGRIISDEQSGTYVI
ncbi:MAG: cell division ATP-binding protein FtsE [bacterium]|nr:cell division ATP-binding protein FtsE [bacterium]